MIGLLCCFRNMNCAAAAVVRLHRSQGSTFACVIGFSFEYAMENSVLWASRQLVSHPDALCYPLDLATCIFHRTSLGCSSLRLSEKPDLNMGCIVTTTALAEGRFLCLSYVLLYSAHVAACLVVIRTFNISAFLICRRSWA